jgi:hypothetical protein
VRPVASGREKGDAEHDHRDAADLQDRQRRLNPAADDDGEAVDDGKERDRGDRDDLREAESPFHGAPHEVVRRVGPGRVHRHDGGKKRGEADSQDCDRPGSGHDEAHPSEEKRRQLAVRPAQVDVLAAGVRQHRAELRVGQRACEREEAGGHPCRQHEQRRSRVLGHDGRFEEDAGADHRADDQSRRVRERQTADELSRLLFGGLDK